MEFLNSGVVRDRLPYEDKIRCRLLTSLLAPERIRLRCVERNDPGQFPGQ